MCKSYSTRTFAIFTIPIILVLFAAPLQSQSLLVTSHYDVARETPIFGTVYDYPVSERVFVTGFAELWYNPENYAFPEDSWPLFSKHWVSYALSDRFSLSVEMEISRNLPGAWSRSPIVGSYTFEPDKWYVQPKVGASFRVF